MDEMLESYSNDDKQARLTLVLTALMSVIIVAMITAAVLSTRACSV